MKFGTLDVSGISYGGQNVKSIYMGDTLIYNRSFSNVSDAVSNEAISAFANGKPIGVYLDGGWENYPYVHFESSNNTNNTIITKAISPTNFDYNNWTMEVVFRLPKSAPGTAWTVGSSIAGFATSNGGERISLDVFGTKAVMYENNGSTGGGSQEMQLEVDHWYYLKTWENGSWMDTKVYLYDLTTNQVVYDMSTNYYYFQSTPTQFVLGGNPGLSYRQSLDIDITMVRFRSGAVTGIPTMPFVMPMSTDKTSSDVFFLIGT